MAKRNHTPAFEADIERDTGLPRIRFNFDNGWSASVVLRYRYGNDGCKFNGASLACCPAGRWGTGDTLLGESEATADEVAIYLADVADRLPPEGHGK